MMEPPLDTLKNGRDEVFRKIGQNIMLFQQLELRLKCLLANARVSGSSEPELLASFSRNQAKIRNRTLGPLVTQFHGDVLTDTCDETNSDEAELSLTEAQFGFGFKLQVTGDLIGTKARLLELVDERNELVHHALLKFDLQSVKGLSEFDNHLGLQADRVRREISLLSGALSALEEGRKKIGEYLASSEGAKAIELLWLQSSDIVELLRNIAQEIARPDGWSLLQVAGAHLHDRAPEEAGGYTTQYGHKSLKALLLASELFDMWDEPTARGGVRVLYRPKPTSTGSAAGPTTE